MPVPQSKFEAFNNEDLYLVGYLIHKFVMNAFTDLWYVSVSLVCVLVMKVNCFKPKNKFHIQGRTFSALDATTLTKLPKIKASDLLDLLFIKKLKLQKKKKTIKSKGKQSLSAFRVNYQHWLKTHEMIWRPPTLYLLSVFQIWILSYLLRTSELLLTAIGMQNISW